MSDKELSRGQVEEIKRRGGGTYPEIDALCDLALRALPGGVGEGWKLVPVEPTKKMLEAGNACDGPAGMKYRAMLAAAPASPEGRSDVCVYPEECAHYKRCIRPEDHDHPQPCKGEPWKQDPAGAKERA